MLQIIDYLIIIDQINEKFERFKTSQLEIKISYIIHNEPVIGNDIAKYLDISKSPVNLVLPKLEEAYISYRQVN